MYLTEQLGGQIKILNARIPVKKALQEKNLPAEDRKKIELILATKKFAIENLSLTPKDNYTQFVPLKHPYPTYVVNASPKWELKNQTWWFPIVGSLPYIGYFNPESAQEKEKELQDQGLDTYLRGVVAFSYLGYLSDPIFSSLLTYSDIDLVDTIIHESVHATFFIKNSAEFNERMAVFIARHGTQQFFVHQHGPKAPQLLEIQKNQDDEIIFSDFMAEEIKSLKHWYSQNPVQDLEVRQKRLAEIQKHFIDQIKPKLKTDAYNQFEKRRLNNAYLMLHSTYMEDLSDFENVFVSCQKDLVRTLDRLKSLQSSKDPKSELKSLRCSPSGT